MSKSPKKMKLINISEKKAVLDLAIQRDTAYARIKRMITNVFKMITPFQTRNVSAIIRGMQKGGGCCLFQSLMTMVSLTTTNYKTCIQAHLRLELMLAIALTCLYKANVGIGFKSPEETIAGIDYFVH